MVYRSVDQELDDIEESRYYSESRAGASDLPSFLDDKDDTALIAWSERYSKVGPLLR